MVDQVKRIVPAARHTTLPCGLSTRACSSGSHPVKRVPPRTMAPPRTGLPPTCRGSTQLPDDRTPLPSSVPSSWTNVNRGSRLPPAARLGVGQAPLALRARSHAQSIQTSAYEIEVPAGFKRVLEWWSEVQSPVAPGCSIGYRAWEADLEERVMQSSDSGRPTACILSQEGQHE